MVSSFQAKGQIPTCMLQKHLFIRQESLGGEGNVVDEGLDGGKCEEDRIQAGNWKLKKN